MYNAERWSKSADYEKGDLINNSRARMVASIAVLAAAAGVPEQHFSGYGVPLELAAETRQLPYHP